MDPWMEVIFGCLRVLPTTQGWEAPPLPEVHPVYCYPCPSLLGLLLELGYYPYVPLLRVWKES